MQDKKLIEYQMLFLNWLEQYHRNCLESGDVLRKLQYLKDKLTEYIYETTSGDDCLKSLDSSLLRTKFCKVPVPFLWTLDKMNGLCDRKRENETGTGSLHALAFSKGKWD